MALIKCPECEKEISSAAKKCPNCGFDLQAETKSKYRKIIVIIIVIILLIVGVIHIYDACTTSTDELVGTCLLSLLFM